MQKGMFRKGLVLGIILLLVGVSISTISGLEINKGKQFYVIVDGPTQGKVGVTYYFNFTLYHSENKTLWLMIDWDDGTPVNWTGSYESYQTVTVSHCWYGGTRLYEIKVRLKDEDGIIGEWGSFYFFVLKGRMTVNSIFIWLLERFSLLDRLLGLINVS